MDQNNTQLRQKVYGTDLFRLIEKENLTDNIKLSGPPDFDQKYSINQVFNLHDSLDNIPLSKTEIGTIFLPTAENFPLELLQKSKTLTQSLDN